MLKGIRFALLAFYLFGYSGVVAQENYIKIHDLRDEWLLFNTRDDFYYPFIDNNLDGVSSISFPLDLISYANYKLYLRAPKETAIFFNQQIISYLRESGDQIFSIDSLRRIYNSDNLFVTIYNPGLKEEGDVAASIVQTASIEPIGDQNKATTEMRRSESSFDDFFGVGVIVLLVFYSALMNMDNKRMKGYYNVARMLSMNIREEVTFKGKVFDGSNIPFIVAHSFLASFVCLFILFSRDAGPNLHHFGAATLAWTMGAAMIFFLLILKYWLLSLAGSLFKLPFAMRHYLEYFRMSNIFFTALFLLVLTLFLGLKSDLNNISQIVVNFVILFLIIRVVALYFKFIRVTSFKNLYLFSYLCSTEILPMVVGLKILISN